jgi:hypothetical protein
MKKLFILLLAILVVISSIFVACSRNQDGSDTGTTVEGLDSVEDEYGFETQEVTDEDGKTVTDSDGNAVTTEVAVKYKRDKKGNLYAQIIDENGDEVEGSTIAVKDDGTLATSTTASAIDDSFDNTTTTTTSPTGTTKQNVPLTDSAVTTKFEGDEEVPKTSDTGTEVNFSVEDQAIITSMLEVPYLYLANYENSDGVPIEIAVHTAVWMAERDGSSRTTYPASPVVLNLFKFYGQTVVNFKTKCNEYAEKAGAPIEYVKKDDTFVISNYTSKVQSVSITSIEDLGNNNFYKITGEVTGCSKKKVVAIIQKNRLDTSLGFSIKALKWS